MIFFCSFTEIYRSSKHLAFRSLYMHHIKYKGCILQASKTVKLLNWPLQQANNSITFLGMTHSTSNGWKIKVHNSLATLLWRRRWSMDSLFLLCIQHQYTIPSLWLSSSSVYPKSESFLEPPYTTLIYSHSLIRKCDVLKWLWQDTSCTIERNG